MAELDSFATPEDIAAGWRPLTPGEEARTEALLARASRIIRGDVPTVDQRIAAGLLDAALVADVTAAMVRRALKTPVEQPAVSQIQESAGPFQASMRLANPDGDLYLTKAERRWLSGRRQQATTVSGILPRTPSVWDTPTGPAAP